MTDCQGNPLRPIEPEPPHDGAAVQCCFCGRLRVFQNGKGRWVTPKVASLEERIDGWVVCPRCHA